MTVPPQSVTLFIVPAGSTTTNQPPTAAATAAPTNGTAPLQVAFDGSGSRDPDGSIVSYAWNFGDGSSANGVTATHTYTNANTYIATLTVTDNQGATGTNNVVITASSSSGGGGGDTLNAPSNLSGKISRSPSGASHFGLDLHEHSPWTFSRRTTSARSGRTRRGSSR